MRKFVAWGLVCTAACSDGIGSPQIGVRRSAIDRAPVPLKELMITDLSVVDDPTRVTDPCDAVRGGTPRVWDFGNQMVNLAALSGESDVSSFTLRFLQTYTQPQLINGFTVPPHPNMQTLIINNWLNNSGGDHLDIALSPFRLLAVSFRPDLRRRDVDSNPLNAGEGRFLYALTFPFPRPSCEFATSFTIIFEYKLHASTNGEVLNWAERIHHLGEPALPPEEYRAELQGLTDDFMASGITTDPGSGQVRINQAAISPGPWELREFRLGTGDLLPFPVENTPDFETFNGSPALGQYINDNQTDILAERHQVPMMLPDTTHFRAGHSQIIDDTPWNAPGIADEPTHSLRHKFALNTCSGCHAQESGLGSRTHVSPRNIGTQSQLSGFLTGSTAPDPVSGQIRQFHALQDRADDLARLIDSGGTL